jgi:hypothetical protein
MYSDLEASETLLNYAANADKEIVTSEMIELTMALDLLT